MEIVEERYGRGSTMITSQLPIKVWHDAIGESTFAPARLDRIVHNAYALQFSSEKRICHMKTNTINQLTDPQGFSPDPLTDLLRSGAQRLVEQAVEAELAVLLEAYALRRLPLDDDNNITEKGIAPQARKRVKTKQKVGSNRPPRCGMWNEFSDLLPCLRVSSGAGHRVPRVRLPD
jgi:hypothetical protein